MLLAASPFEFGTCSAIVPMGTTSPSPSDARSAIAGSCASHKLHLLHRQVNEPHAALSVSLRVNPLHTWCHPLPERLRGYMPENHMKGTTRKEAKACRSIRASQTKRNPTSAGAQIVLLPNCFGLRDIIPCFQHRRLDGLCSQTTQELRI